MGSNLRRLVPIIILLAITVAPISSVRGSGFSVHEAIWIRGDPDFTAANGVVSGSGAMQDPYVIDGWVILVAISKVFFAQGFNTGILVENTTSHFIIRNVLVHHGLTSSANIVLKNVTNGRIEASRVESGNVGIALRFTNNTALVDNEIRGFGVGLSLGFSHGNLVEGNLIQDSDRPVFALGSSRNRYVGNIMERAALGVSINRNSSFNVFERNTIRDSNFGIGISLDSHSNTVRENLISVEREGIGVGIGSQQNTIKDNIILDSGLGILLNQAFETRVESNSIIASTRTSPPGVERFTGRGIWVVDSTQNWLTNNTITAPVGISICRSTFAFSTRQPDHVTLLLLNDLSGGRPVAFGPTGCP